jgi:hypothetical protein
LTGFVILTVAEAAWRLEPPCDAELSNLAEMVQQPRHRAWFVWRSAEWS